MAAMSPGRKWLRFGLGLGVHLSNGHGRLANSRLPAAPTQSGRAAPLAQSTPGTKGEGSESAQGEGAQS